MIIRRRTLVAIQAQEKDYQRLLVREKITRSETIMVFLVT